MHGVWSYYIWCSVSAPSKIEVNNAALSVQSKVKEASDIVDVDVGIMIDDEL